MNRLDLGAVSAYALAKAKGYQGTEEEFATLMMQSGDNALRAEAAADRAEEILGSIPPEYTDLSNQVDENTGNVAALTEEMASFKTISEVVPGVLEEGKYVSNSGAWGTSKGFSIYEPTQLHVGDKITFTAQGYLSNVAVLSVFNKDTAGYAPIIIPEDNEARVFEHVATQDGNYYISSNNNATVSYTVTYKNPVEVLLNDVDLIDKRVEGIEQHFTGETIDVEYPVNGFVRASDGVIVNHATYLVSDPFPLYQGETLSFESAVPDAEVVCVLSKWDEDGTACEKVIAAGSRGVQRVTHTASDSVEYLRICKSSRDDYTTTVPTIVRNLTETVMALAKKIDQLEKANGQNDVFAFVNVGVIGDSLASGASNFTNASGANSSADRPEYSWGKYIEREHGVPVTLFSQGGASARSWLTGAYGLTAMQAAEACDCYIIGLGVNDKYLYGDDYLGTSADVAVGNEDGNADTFYGNYSKIIAALIAKSPRCKIFCLTMPSTQSDPASTYNVAIREVAELYSNAHLIDLESDDYYGGSEYTALWNMAHSTAAGYKAMADHLWKRLNAYMRDNLSEFTEIQWILEDHN